MRVTDRSSAAATPSQIVDYVYDAMNRRLAKTVGGAAGMSQLGNPVLSGHQNKPLHSSPAKVNNLCSLSLFGHSTATARFRTYSLKAADDIADVSVHMHVSRLSLCPSIQRSEMHVDQRAEALH